MIIFVKKILSMNLVNYSYIFFLIFLFLILEGCERYIGYNYDVESIGEKARVFGSIKNIYTGEPVISANIQIGIFRTSSDHNGSFLIFYNLGTDEERNKPVPVSVTATDYYPYNDEILIFPQDNMIDIQMVYAAPIIVKHYGGWHQSLSGITYLVLQAEVTDYQGINTLDSVQATFFINDGEESHEVLWGMKQIYQTSDITAFYQIYANPLTFSPWFLEERFLIRVWDNEGYQDLATRALAQMNPLFDPILP
jgi:hypothetical protein